MKIETDDKVFNYGVNITNIIMDFNDHIESKVINIPFNIGSDNILTLQNN